MLCYSHRSITHCMARTQRLGGLTEETSMPLSFSRCTAEPSSAMSSSFSVSLSRWSLASLSAHLFRRLHVGRWLPERFFGRQRQDGQIFSRGRHSPQTRLPHLRQSYICWKKVFHCALKAANVKIDASLLLAYRSRVGEADDALNEVILLKMRIISSSCFL